MRLQSLVRLALVPAAVVSGWRSSLVVAAPRRACRGRLHPGHRGARPQLCDSECGRQRRRPRPVLGRQLLRASLRAKRRQLQADHRRGRPHLRAQARRYRAVLGIQ